MKTYKLSLILCCVILIMQHRSFGQETGLHVLFNNNWSFHKGDLPKDINPNADNLWNPVQIPHDWSIREPFSDRWASSTAYLPGGVGWYKKKFTVKKGWASGQVYIYFDGVYKNSEVWINGHYLGKRPNGFTSFQYELTKYLKYTGKNILLVKVDHSEFADSRWYTGSGIYRNVYLFVKNKIHIAPWNIAFASPVANAKNAAINLKITVSNSLSANTPVSVIVNLMDSTGKVAGKWHSNVVLAKGDNSVSLNPRLYSPLLWSTKTPNLYALQVCISKNGKIIDETEQKVGIRTINFNKDSGFYLNGENLKIKGVCIHDDAGALGTAVPEEVWERRLKILKEAGVNAIRLSHNPHADYLYNLCDSMGLLVMDEAFDEWEIGKNKWVQGWNVGTPSTNGYHEYFKEWANRDLADMILRDRNHPCIIMWSIGNEIDYPNDPYTDPILNTGKNPQIYGRGYEADHPSVNEITVIAKQLVNVVKSIDQTRPVTAALAGVVMSNVAGYPEALDIVGYNYQEYRYKQDHSTYSDRIIYGSENGMQNNAWEAVDTNTFICAQFLWTGIDYMGEAGEWPSRSSGPGLLDMAGFKKPEFFKRQSLWSDKPMVFMTASEIPDSGRDVQDNYKPGEPKWNWPEGGKLKITGITNCRQAELFINGRSLGRKYANGPKKDELAWNVNYEPGTIQITGLNNNMEVAWFSLNTAGSPAKIFAKACKLQFSKKPGVCQLEIHLTDNNGNPVYDAVNPVTLHIHGAATLMGLESGSLTSHESYQSNTRNALRGKLIAYIQTTGKKGKIGLEITSPGLKPYYMSLSSN